MRPFPPPEVFVPRHRASAVHAGWRGLACVCGVILCLAQSSCSATAYRADADREVTSILGDATAAELGNRKEWVVRPEPAPEPAPPAPAGKAEADAAGAVAAPPTEAAPPLVLYDLQKSLQTAFASNREFLARRESLYQQGLSTSLTRFQFGPQFTAAVSYLWSTQEGGSDQQGTSLQFGASQILPTGGTLALTSSASALWPYGAGIGFGSDSYSTVVGATLTQPLLRGSGYEISHEALTQAERSLVYSIRDFELYRENFSIQVARTYYDLVSQQRTLAIEDANYEGAVFDRGKAEALYQVGRNSEQEVFRARRREIEAKDQLISARASYDRAIDEFKILLGLPTTTRLDVADSEAPFEPVRMREESAVAAARHNRLDLISQQQQVEDAERALRIATDNLLPDVNLVANYGILGADNQVAGAGPEDWNASVGVSFEIPLQRKAQRNGLVSAQIALEQSRRSFALRLDQLDLEIRAALRNLKSIEERIVLQEEQVVQERGAVTVTEIRYESGKLDNRDLLEARQALVNAQNALIRLKVDHFIGRLGLLRDLGLFFVDAQGGWQ